jgi:hypothetical protein
MQNEGQLKSLKSGFEAAHTNTMDHTLCLNGRQKKIQRLGAWSLGRAMFIAQGALHLPE